MGASRKLEQAARSEGASAQLAAALGRLDALINWERKGRGRMRVTLEPARDLCRRLGEPQRCAPAVHVAGSKGKGSVASLVAGGLTAAGLRVGRYGSPHVERIHERVVVDGREVCDAALATGIERALAAREAALAQGTPAREATWFDLLTGAAWCVFAAQEVDRLVVECGLGGRFDSTNTLDGEVCVITSIELEHTSVLGPTREAIASEKAGILARGATLVTGVPAQDGAGRAIDRHARQLGARVLRPVYLEAAERPPIEGCNVALAALVLDELGCRGGTGREGRRLGAELLTPDVVRAARLPGRLERMRLGRTAVVLDGAHTPDSVRGVVTELAGGARRAGGAIAGPPGRPVVILGLAVDKDLEGVLKSLSGAVDRVLATSVGGALARPPEQIAGAAEALGLEAETASSPRLALERARELAGAAGWVLVLGSLYLAGAVRPLLQRDPCDPTTC